MFHFVKDPKTNLNEKVDIEMEGLRANHLSGSPGWNWFLDQPSVQQTDVNFKVQDLSGEIRDLLDFTSNNYLGLSCNKEVVQAGKDALDKYGAGVCSSRLLGGNIKLTEELETLMAKLLKREAALVYSSSYASNLGIFVTLLGKGDVVLSDQSNHASLIDGIRMSKATKVVYKHLDMDDLESKLKMAADANVRMIVTDGVFSMDGEYCPLPKIKELAVKYNAVIFLDDCHGIGVSGKTGQGTEEYFNMEGAADILVGTLGKAFGSMGGIVAGSKNLIDLLARTSRTFVFSTALSPATMATSMKACEILMDCPAILKKLNENTMRFRDGMKKLGYEVKGTDHPCCPVMIRDDTLTWKVSDFLFKNGVLASWIVTPVAKPGEQKLRIIIKASHSVEDVDTILGLFREAKEMFLRSPVIGA